MTLKKFIISSSCPTGPREILKNGSLGYMFQPKDSSALSKLILKYYHNKKKCKNISKKLILVYLGLIIKLIVTNTTIQ